MDAVSMTGKVNQNYNYGNIRPSVSGTRCLNNQPMQDTVSFTGKKKTESGEKKKSGFIHKTLVTLVSAPYPGLGQALNGQWGKAFAIGLSFPVAAFATLATYPLALPAVVGAYYLGSMIDTYRNA